MACGREGAIAVWTSSPRSARPFGRVLCVVCAFALMLQGVAFAVTPDVTAVSSTSHPVQTTWYDDDSADVEWTGGLPLTVSVDSTATALGSAVAGGYLYAAMGSEGVAVYDVRDPAAPVLVGEDDGSVAVARDVAVCGRTLIVLTQSGTGGLVALDISDPTAPAYLASATVPNGGGSDLELVGDVLYVTQANGLSSFCVRDPGNPMLMGSSASTGVTVDGTVSGRTAFAATGAAFLYAWDVTVPGAIKAWETLLERFGTAAEAYARSLGGRPETPLETLAPRDRNYGIVFQSYALFPNLTVADNVAYGLVNRREPKDRVRARVAELLALVGLPGSEGKYPAQLSGGQQQRIALARALATSPGLLLLDEPLSALDAIVRVHLRQEIKTLQRKLGVTTIMVTHDQEEALSVADRIVVMNHGVIEQVGTPLEVYREPATPFVADFVGRVNVVPAVRGADGRLRIGATEFQGNGLAGSGRPGEAVTVYLRPEDVLARPIAPGEPNVFEADIERIEFLGAYCLVTVGGAALAEHRLEVVLSLNFLAEQRLEVGSRLPLKLLPERLRVFQ